MKKNILRALALAGVMTLSLGMLADRKSVV